jgi:hypothetical protein
MDPTTVAVGIAAIVGPLLPYLVKSGEEAAKEAGKKVGAATWDRASAIWEKLHPKVEASPSAKVAVERAAEHLDDKRVVGALELELEELLKQDPTLLQELADELSEAKAAGVTVTASGERSVAIGGGVTGSTITTGDQFRPPEPSGR